METHQTIYDKEYGEAIFDYQHLDTQMVDQLLGVYHLTFSDGDLGDVRRQQYAARIDALLDRRIELYILQGLVEIEAIE